MNAPANSPLRQENTRVATQARRRIGTIPLILRRIAGSTVAQALLWAALLFLLHFWLTTRHITFPFWYHWDEEGKATQVLSGHRDFHHPLLLIKSVSVIRRTWLPDTRSRQDVTVLGRRISAAFAAGALSAMALAAWIVAGPLAGLMAGILIGLDPGLFQAAHFFKEDSALLFGWAALIASIGCYSRRPGMAAALLVGAAGALSASSKYIGILPAILAVPFLGMSGKVGRWRTLAFLVAFVAVCFLVNVQIVRAPQAAVTRIAREIEDLRDENGIARPWVLWGRALGVGGIAAMVIAMVQLRGIPRPAGRTQWFALTTMVFYFACLLFVTRIVSRYMLPMYLVSWWFAGIGAAWLMRRAARPRFVLLLSCTLVAALVVIRVEEGRSGWRQFSGPDTRLELARQLDRLATAGDRVMLDFTVNLPGPYAEQRQVEGWMSATPMRPVDHWNPARGPDMYESILREGFTLVAVDPTYVKRYLSESISAESGQFGDARWRRPFYRRLMRDGRVEVTVEGVRRSLVSPPLALIRIADPR